MEKLLPFIRLIFGAGYIALHGYIVYQVYKVNTFWHTVLSAATLIFGDMYWCYQWGAVALGIVTLIVGILSFLSGQLLASE